MEDLITLVADAGGTKTEWWAAISVEDRPFIFRTGGINASVSSDEEILESVEAMVFKLSEELAGHIRLYFYGAGCNSIRTEKRLKQLFSKSLGDRLLYSEFRSDLEGAAVALFGDKQGIACIMGTGSASSRYDGRKIIDSVPSLGFILGDEGSGSFMGKELINRYYKRSLSPFLMEALEETYRMHMPDLLERVYRRSGSASFLASFVPFLKVHEEEDEISHIIDSSLKLFFEKNVLKYNDAEKVPIRFSGGVAFAFKNRLIRLADEIGLTADRFIEGPTESLGSYHMEKLTS